VSEALNALAEGELEVPEDFAGSKKISPRRCGMPLQQQGYAACFEMDFGQNGIRIMA
jgi:hypothetical protein